MRLLICGTILYVQEENLAISRNKTRDLIASEDVSKMKYTNMVLSVNYPEFISLIIHPLAINIFLPYEYIFGIHFLIFFITIKRSFAIIK